MRAVRISEPEPTGFRDARRYRVLLRDGPLELDSVLYICHVTLHTCDNGRVAAIVNTAGGAIVNVEVNPFLLVPRMPEMKGLDPRDDALIETLLYADGYTAAIGSRARARAAIVDAAKKEREKLIVNMLAEEYARMPKINA